MIKVYTTNPDGLLAAIDNEIKEGTIKTWEKRITSDGEEYYRHIGGGQLKDKGGITWTVDAKNRYIKFSVGYYNSVKNSEKPDISGRYHSEFIQLLLCHYRELIDSIKIIPDFKE